MAIESFWAPGDTMGSSGGDVGPNWFANKDLEDISNALGQMSAPVLYQAIQRFAQSMTPEGKRRLADAFTGQQLENAQTQGAYAASIAKQQGLSSSYAAGLNINALNEARRRAAVYASQLNNPQADLNGALGLYSSLYGMRNPKSQPHSFLGDVFGLAGDVLPFVNFGGGKFSGKSGGLGTGSDTSSGSDGQSLFSL